MDEEGVPLEDWPWRAIVTLERRWQARIYRKPKCRICDRPLACGQTDSHFTCRRLLDALENT